MGFFDDIVKTIDQLENGVQKAVDTLEQTADKPEKLLTKVEDNTSQTVRTVDGLAKPD